MQIAMQHLMLLEDNFYQILHIHRKKPRWQIILNLITQHGYPLLSCNGRSFLFIKKSLVHFAPVVKYLLDILQNN